MKWTTIIFDDRKKSDEQFCMLFLWLSSLSICEDCIPCPDFIIKHTNTRDIGSEKDIIT